MQDCAQVDVFGRVLEGLLVGRKPEGFVGNRGTGDEPLVKG